MLSKSAWVLISMVVAVGLSSCTSAEKKQIQAEQAEAKAKADAEATLFGRMTPQEIETRAQDVVIFGYPLILMDVTKNVSTAVDRPRDGFAPINQISHKRSFPDPTFRNVVSPNADTLYSSAWLDLSKEPMVLSLPATGMRYYMIEMLDAWTNVFASPGTRTTGNERGDYAIVGPQWSGALPPGLRKIQAPTNMVWLIGRVNTAGPKDYNIVRTIQDRFVLTPLSGWGRPYLPPDMVGRNNMSIDTKTPPVEQVARMNADMFLPRLSELMKDNPPAGIDAEAMENLASIGVKPGEHINYMELSPQVRQSLENGVRRGLERVAALGKYPQGRSANGWTIMQPVGVYGVNYDQRAAIAWVGLGANVPEDAVYPRATTDANGSPLNGINKYVLRFPKDGTPPVNGFWSLTMYDSHQFFVPNKINRYAIGDRNELRKNRDGSTDIYIQADSPGKSRESNWLPAPRGEFNVMMRLYWPKQAVLSNEWQIPGIQKVQPRVPLRQQRLSKRLAKAVKN